MKLWRKPLDADDFQAPKGEVQVIPERCKGCGFCIEFCPRNVLAESKEFNSKGYHPPEIADIDSCVYCQLCELICPEFAIYVIEVKKEGEEGTDKGEDWQSSGKSKEEDKDKSKEEAK
ncbi:MAG: ferredoxin family protein [Thermoplasmata archaeon]|nr:MAG: ferredoxin family protein [Thermoplasmata archaeon]